MSWTRSTSLRLTVLFLSLGRIGAMALALTVSQARAETIKAPDAVPPAAAPSTTLATSHDEANRMTVPVMIDGKGPFDFVIDTGADRTVISRELAAELKLPPGAPVAVHATSGVSIEATAVVEAVQVGPVRVGQFEAPLLARANLGAAGMLGIDILKDQSVVMDFKAGKLSVQAARTSVDAPHTIVVYGKRRYGELILVDAYVRGVQVYVILDSGAQNSVANPVLARILAKRRPERSTLAVDILSVTGGTTAGAFALLPTMTLGGVTLNNLPIAFADLDSFSRFHLEDKPAMLLGVDVLSAFDRVTVDFKHKQANFALKTVLGSYSLPRRETCMSGATPRRRAGRA